MQSCKPDICRSSSGLLCHKHPYDRSVLPRIPPHWTGACPPPDGGQTLRAPSPDTFHHIWYLHPQTDRYPDPHAAAHCSGSVPPPALSGCKPGSDIRPAWSLHRQNGHTDWLKWHRCVRSFFPPAGQGPDPLQKSKAAIPLYSWRFPLFACKIQTVQSHVRTGDHCSQNPAVHKAGFLYPSFQQSAIAAAVGNPQYQPPPASSGLFGYPQVPLSGIGIPNVLHPPGNQLHMLLQKHIAALLFSGKGHTQHRIRIPFFKIRRDIHRIIQNAGISQPQQGQDKADGHACRRCPHSLILHYYQRRLPAPP